MTRGNAERVGMDGRVHELPPAGRYTARQVGQLAGVSGQTVGQWARNGYIGASHKRTKPFPLIYSFQDIAEAIIVHELLEHQANYRAIRITIGHLRGRFGHFWPLSRVPLATTPGGEIVAAADEALYELSRGWQQVSEHDLTAIVGLLQHGGWAARQLGGLEHIEVDPKVLSGRPAIRGTRIPAEKVAHLASRPGGRRILTADYELSTAEIEDAARWWAAAQGYEKAAA